MKQTNMSLATIKSGVYPASLVGSGYEDRLVDGGLNHHNGTGEPTDLLPVINSLFLQQRQSWPGLEASFSQLGRLSTHEVALGEETNVVVQLNERRAGRVRPGCFLDAENLPPEQRGTAFAGLFVAINPYPILNDHLTGIYPRHTDQSIDLLLQPALRISRALGPEFAVFYNGPLAGASAPGHAHVQAVRYGKFPVEQSLERIDKPGLVRRESHSTFLLPPTLGRTVLSIESPDISTAEHTVREVIGCLPREGDDHYDEPRLNLLIRTLPNGVVRTLITPRTKPEVKLGNESVIRPATLEAIAGIVVVSTVDDHEHLRGNPDGIRGIYAATTRGSEETREHLGKLLAA
ncbi:MAG: DUF4922 domain-containing protein [Candidatus Saccharimonadales bacterium]